MQTYLYSLLNSPSFSSAFASSASLAFLRPSLCSPPAAETLAASAVMASSNVSTVYISVIDDVISKVREDFITYGVGDAVLNELQAVRISDLSTPSSRPFNYFLISAVLMVLSPIRRRKP
jgi:transcription initiation factor TFIIA large subunit